jgi:hypothetical protein
VSLQLHRPDGQGGLERRTLADQNWRGQLRSPRWGASLKGGQLPSLGNAEMNPTRTALSVGFWLGLGAVTFVLLVLGYGTGFWH